ncbi:hypothetical protein DFP72DRAFT_1152186 [Ephemerocybe angulata]|uniref:Uncharacterized protein n=1 Tax=Ephemerocybe angulata TaxID=980116 RepID=A0A8H6LWI6_9AGAR|nr:hypothetical protein DFP72DRAFT_1152186 [Tulosesus angulatus]
MSIVYIIRGHQVLVPMQETFLRLFNGLGASYERRFKQTSDPLDIVEAISLKQRAIQGTPDGHADLPQLLKNLGECIVLTLSELDNPRRTVEAGLSYFKAEATSRIGPPRIRLEAAVYWSRLLLKFRPLSSDVLRLRYDHSADISDDRS